MAFLVILCACILAGASEGQAGDALQPGVPETRTAKQDLVIDLGGGVTMQFVLISPGSFMMGSGQSEIKDQKPPHPVTISQPFYLGKYEVTQQQWEAIMSNTPSIHRGPHYPGSPKYPVENISWHYCKLFLTNLKEKVGGYEFRLPTEAEWEYACRAGTTNEYNFGDRDAALSGHAWWSGNSDGQPHPVGMKKPNGWGLYDMHGNVWEWCNDIYGPYSSAAISDPAGASSGGSRVLRGGAYNSVPKHLSSAYRHDLDPDDCYRYYGLRCAVSARPARTN